MNTQNITLASEQEDANKSLVSKKTTVVAPEKAGGESAGSKESVQPPAPAKDEGAANLDAAELTGNEEVALTADEKHLARIPCMWTITADGDKIHAAHQQLGLLFSGTISDFNKKFLKR